MGHLLCQVPGRCYVKHSSSKGVKMAYDLSAFDHVSEEEAEVFQAIRDGGRRAGIGLDPTTRLRYLRWSLHEGGTVSERTMAQAEHEFDTEGPSDWSAIRNEYANYPGLDPVELYFQLTALLFSDANDLVHFVHEVESINPIIWYSAVARYAALTDRTPQEFLGEMEWEPYGEWLYTLVTTKRSAATG